MKRTGKTSRSVEVEVDLDEFEDEDLLTELEQRGAIGLTSDCKPIVERAYDAYRTGNLRALDIALRDLFDAALGRLVADSPLMERA